MQKVYCYVASSIGQRICRLGSLAIVLNLLVSPCSLGQGTGGMGGGMGGMGQGMHGSQNSPPADTAPPPPKHPNPFGSDGPPLEGVEARAGALEKFIFGTEHKKMPIKTRVEKLEKRLVPYEHHKPDEDLNQRVDHLWSILAPANRPAESPPAQ